MGFSNFTNIWTILFPIVVLLYYFFRKKYEEKTISSTLFWDQSLRETKASPFLKNLQRNALFYLQMLALLLLVFLLMGPYFPSDKASQNQFIFIVDTSASMQAGKDKSILDRHKEQMYSIIKENENIPISIVTTGKEPTFIVRHETSKERIKSAVEALALTYEEAYIDRSIEAVQSIIGENPVEIHVFTDGMPRTAFENDEKSNAIWHVHNEKTIYENVSLLKFGAVQTDDHVRAIVQVHNQTEKPVEGKVIIQDALSGKTVQSKVFELKENEEGFVAFDQLPKVKALRAKLEIKDDYTVDNEAYALLNADVSEVLIDQQLHELLLKAFVATGVPVSLGGVNELRNMQDTSIIVTNDVSLLESGTKPIVLIGRNDVQATSISGAITTKEDPLLSFVDLSDVYVEQVYPPFEEMETIAMIGETPFIQRSARGDLILLTDIQMTDWPLHPSFPLFFWSVIQSVQSDTQYAGTFTPKERKSILASNQGIELFTVEDEFVASYNNGASFIAPDQPGIYKLLEGEREKLLAVQLEDEEKSLKRGTSFQIGSQETNEQMEVKKTQFNWMLIIFILLLLFIEWEVQRRRGYTY